VRIKEPKVIFTLAVIVILGIVFLVSFGYNVKKVGKNTDFGVSLREYETLPFPTFTFVTWDINYFSSVSCRHCHWNVANENCSTQPLLQYTITGRNPFGMMNEVQFNLKEELVANKEKESVIFCSPLIVGDGYGAIYFYDSSAENLKFGPTSQPGGELFVAFGNDTHTYIGLKKVETIYDNGVKLTDYERVNVNMVLNKNIQPVQRIFYGTYSVTKFTQNSEEARKGDFWSFIGSVGGTAFLFLLIYRGVMFVFTLFCFVRTGSEHEVLLRSQSN